MTGLALRGASLTLFLIVAVNLGIGRSPRLVVAVNLADSIILAVYLRRKLFDSGWIAYTLLAYFGWVLGFSVVLATNPDSPDLFSPAFAVSLAISVGFVAFRVLHCALTTCPFSNLVQPGNASELCRLGIGSA
jgi:hypothetical protein